MAGGKSDELKGRVKEAAGSLLANQKLKREGRADQAAGKVKRKLGDAVDKVRDAVAGKTRKKGKTKKKR